MKKTCFVGILFTALLACQSVQAQVLRAFTPRFSNPSVKGNIVFVSNSIVETASENVNEAPPGGAAVNNNNVGVNIDIDGNGSTNVFLINMGDTWKYFSNGTTPVGAWKTLGYVDVAWSSGPGELGYGDGDESTCIPSGGGGTLCTPTGTKYITAYFRKTITIANPALYGSYIIKVKRDDGFVLYINGTEYGRDNMPAGAIINSTVATSNLEDETITITLPNTVFAIGNNSIAVEVHQSSNTSSDISFDLSLEGTNTITKFINMGDGWRCITGATAPAGLWKTLGYNDAGWGGGVFRPTEIGYGDGDEAYCIPSGGGGTACLPTGTKYISAYFRKTINIANIANFRSFQFKVKRDDGFVLYVNGTELHRDNMPGGAIVHGTLASADVDDKVITFSVPSSYFLTGNNDIAVEVHQRSATSDDLSFNLSLEGYSDILIPFASNWKYLDNNTRPANWQTTGFNDAAWVSNYAPLGYGDPHIYTTVNFGADPNNKYVTTYFRKVINIPNPSAFPNYLLKLVRDDGAAVYINGVEVVRTNLPAGVLAHGTIAPANISGGGETAENLFYIPASYFVAGNNTIAVEMHQDAITSTDLGFDLQLEGNLNPTFNSSSADLALPSCSHVLFAGLYWGATQGVDGTNTAWINNETSIKLKRPGDINYTDLTSTQTDYHNGTLVSGLPHTGYRCFRDITSIINAGSANGTYTIANVVSPASINNATAGWTIVIAYSDPATIVRNLTVYDGSVIMNGGDPALHVPISGFLTPPSGPVSCELGAVVYDGDRVSVDEFSFKQNSNPLVGTYTNLTPNATSNLNDMWNGTISHLGTVVTTRNPAYQNTLGYDADIITVPNPANAVLGNNQSSASIQFSSPSENYMLQVATTSISQYTPTFNIAKSTTDVNGGSVQPGDVLRYTITFTNAGNDASTGTMILDNIPTGTTYKAGSLQINSVVKSDGMANDEAEYDFVNNRVVFRIGTGANGSSGGEVAPSISGNVTFEVYTARSCAVFACNSTISNRARISYGGKLSLISLADSSGVIVSGCNTPGPVSDIMTGACAPLNDTILTNTCPVTNVMLPIVQYAGYNFYSGTPFGPGTRYNPLTPITTTGVYYAYFDGLGSCDDTVRINVFITACPDIDDDNDGLPDYLEINNPLALANHDGDAFPNWNDATYPGFVDYNSDGVNDLFDPSADADNDGIPNFYDPTFAGWVDSNGDGVNDNMDKDRDGIPNHLDLDSDNDGIPDVVESYGVDANGDGRIDSYTDTDNDGFSQNVDASAGGVIGSGNGLTELDTDSDGIGNYLDLDSDNDGIPDLIEVFGSDINNSGRTITSADADGDGFDDAIDGDADNNGAPENSVNAFLRTGADGNNDGRTDSWPFKNMDNDARPNPYDLDSDNDGITDVSEAQFTDADWNGRVDGVVNTNGRNTALAALPALSIPNTDGVGRQNPYDIDSDDDGIPDNVEGLTTFGYILPGVGDTDNDGIINTYDDFAGYGGDGIHVVDTDVDGTPDYLDADTDNDGLIDIVEGNDLNLNALPDDLVTLTGIDTDSDGLDDRFDNNNTTIEGTSAYMGNGGTFVGDATPGSITTVQRSSAGWGCATERDWRCYPYVLTCDIITFKATMQGQQVKLNWTVLCKQDMNHFIIERSVDRVNFTGVINVPGRSSINEMESYDATDNIIGISNDILYYRLRSVAANNKVSVSQVIALRRSRDRVTDLQVLPNPVRDQLQLLVQSQFSGPATIYIIDGSGRTVKVFKESLLLGSNTFSYNSINNLPGGQYYIRMDLGTEIITEKFTVIRY